MKPRYRITIIPDGVLSDGYLFVVTHWRDEAGPIYGGRLLAVPGFRHYVSCIGYKLF